MFQGSHFAADKKAAEKIFEIIGNTPLKVPGAFGRSLLLTGK